MFTCLQAIFLHNININLIKFGLQAGYLCRRQAIFVVMISEPFCGQKCVYKNYLKDRLRMFNSCKWILGQLKVLLAGRHRQYFSTMAILKKSACRCIFVRYNPACLKGRQFPALLRQLVFREQGTLYNSAGDSDLTST